MSSEEKNIVEPDLIMRLIDLLEIKPSSVIKWLIGIIITAFFSGYSLCYFVMSNKHEILIIGIETKHQRDLAEAEKKGEESAYAEMERQSKYINQVNTIIKEKK